MQALIQLLNRPGYAQGVFWAIVTCFISASNDVLMKLMGQRLDGFEVASFRFLFSFITLLPFILNRGIGTFWPERPMLHILRAVLGVAAVTCCCYAVVLLPLTEVTTIFFTQPLFVLVLAAFFLAERVGINRWVATLVGFAGILVTMQPKNGGLNIYVLIPIAAAILFSLQDILIKRMVKDQDRLTMLVQFAGGTTLAGLIPLYFVWVEPTLHELFFLFLLGAGANLIQVTLFKAFAATDVSALAPFRCGAPFFHAFRSRDLFRDPAYSHLSRCWAYYSGDVVCCLCRAQATD